MKRWIFFFAFLGVLSVVSAISGISEFSAGTGKETTIAMYPNILSRFLSGGVGVVLLTIAWAIYERRPWVWHLVFYIFAASWLSTVWGIYLDLALQYPAQSKVETMLFAGAIGLLFAGIGVYWGYRWYQKKEYFFPIH